MLPMASTWTIRAAGRLGAPARATAIALALLVCAGAGLQAAKVKVEADADPAFDFKTVRTWGWAPEGAGDVIMARAHGDDPAPVKQRTEPVVMAAVARELGLRGLSPASAGQPDITVRYYLLVTVGADAQAMGQFLPPTVNWGLPPFAPQTTSLDVVQRGTIVLDAKSTSLERVVWRGRGQSDIDQIQTDAKRNALINDVVRNIVKKFPVKK
jgi:hypothetical protein